MQRASSRPSRTSLSNVIRAAGCRPGWKDLPGPRVGWGHRAEGDRQVRADARDIHTFFWISLFKACGERAGTFKPPPLAKTTNCCPLLPRDPAFNPCVS
jgi:hypothetical protein